MRIRGSYVVTLIGIVFFAFFLLALSRTKPDDDSSASTNNGVPQISVDKEKIDMGQIINTGPTTADATITNIGTGTLTLTNITGSCPCLTGTVPKINLAPSESMPLKINVDPFLIVGFAGKKTLSIHSNDENRNVFMITVLFTIEPEFELDPKTFEFGDVRKGQNIERKLLLRQLRQEPVEITKIDVGSTLKEALEIVYEKRPDNEWAVPGKPEYWLTARLLPGVRVGEFRAYPRIFTNVVRLDQGLGVGVTANIGSFYTMTPDAMIRIPKATPGQQNIAMATVKSEQPISLENITLDIEGLVAELVPAQDANTVSIRIDADPSIKPGRIRGKLAFDIKSELETVRDELPVYGLVQ